MTVRYYKILSHAHYDITLQVACYLYTPGTELLAMLSV